MSLLEDCITRRLGFRPETSSVRIEASCDELRLNGICERRRA
jgi:Fur family ferric uptake transcriptional regulator